MVKSERKTAVKRNCAQSAIFRITALTRAKKIKRVGRGAAAAYVLA